MTQRLIGGRYEVERELGKGGMGAVLLTRDRVLNRPLAVKTMNRPDDEGSKARFIEEAQINGQLAHPNIVSIHELGQDPSTGELFLAMKLIDGSDLKAIFDKLAKNDRRTSSEFNLRRILRLFLKVCDALDFAHSKGIVHRDIKPANIMLGGEDDDEVLVMDWGLAKSYRESDGAQGILTARSAILQSVRSASGADASSASAELTQQGTVVGTPVYMPPEQADNPAGVDHRADIYALGAILYELLCGKAPYKGSSFQVLNALFKAAPEPPSRRSPSREIPPALEAITLKAMARRKEDRYQSAAELRRDLERFLDGEAVSAYQEDFKEALRRWAGQRKGLLVSFGFSMLALVLGLGYSFRLALNERKAARELASVATLQGFDARLQAWKTAQLEGMDELARTSCAAVEKSFAFVRNSEEALPLSNLTALHRDAQLALQGVSETLALRVTAVEQAELSETGPRRLFDELETIRNTLILNGPLSKQLDNLDAALDCKNKKQSRALHDAKTPLEELQAALSAVTSLIDEAFAESLLARFPQLLAKRGEELQQQLSLGRCWPLFEARAFWRMRREREAAAIVARALNEQSGEARDPVVMAALQAIALRLQREPKQASLEVQRDAFDAAIKASRDNATQNVETILQRVQDLASRFLKDDSLPPLTVPTSLSPAWLFMRRAEVHRDIGAFDEAARDFERAVTIAPADVYIRMSQIERMTSRISSGSTVANLIRALRSLAQLTPDAWEQSPSGVPEAAALQSLLNQAQIGGIAAISNIEDLVNRGQLENSIARRYLLEFYLSELQTTRTRELCSEALEEDPQDLDAIAVMAESFLFEPKALHDEIARLESCLAVWPKQIETCEREIPELQKTQNELQTKIDDLKRQTELTGGDERRSRELKEKLRETEREKSNKIGEEAFRRRRIRFFEDSIRRAQANLPRYREEVKGTKDSFESKALNLALKALQVAPQHDRLNYVIGEIYRRQGRLKDSIPYLKRGAQASMFTERHLSLARACLDLDGGENLELGVEAIRRGMSFDNIAARGTHEVEYSFKNAPLPADPVFNEVLAGLRWKQQKKAEAIVNISRAIALAEAWLLNTRANAQQKALMTERVDELRLRLALWHRELGLETEARMLLDQASKGKGPAAKKAGELLGR